MMKTVVFLLGLLAVAQAGDSYYYNSPCSNDRMFRANTGDLSNFIRAAGLREWLYSGACIWYGIFGTEGVNSKSVTNLVNTVSNIASTVNMNTIGSMDAAQVQSALEAYSASLKPSSGGSYYPNTFIDDCYIREFSFKSFCVGYPGDVYGLSSYYSGTSVGRKMLGDDDDDRYYGPSWRYFTRFATSAYVKAKIGPDFGGSSITGTTYSGWSTVQFYINICLDIDRSGPLGIPGTGDAVNDIAWCGDLDYDTGYGR